MSLPADSAPSGDADERSSLSENLSSPEALEGEPEVVSNPSASQTQLPPEAQGEANGGPLGCCLGVMVGLLLSISVALVSRFYADPLAHVFGSALSTIVRVTMAIVAVICVIIFARLGWRIGKRFYREYDPPVVPRRGRRPKTAAKAK